MSFRFLVVDTYYQNFIASVYAATRSLVASSYQEQLHALLDRCFGTSDFYSTNLRQLGHEAKDVIGNCEPLQRAWAQEHDIPWRMVITKSQKNRRLLKVLKAQIQRAKPDVLYLQNLYWPGTDFIREIRADVKLIVGQIAYGLSPTLDLSVYDLILTSFPHFVDRFRQMGGSCEYFRIGFGAKTLQRLEDTRRRYPIVFVGTYSGRTGPHAAGTRLLEYVTSRAPVQFWGQGQNALQPDSPIRQTFHGEAWGIDMYKVLAQGGIVLNRHAEWAERYANNMRLYEATGVGAMLLTDDKDNLNNLFQVGKEVVAYRSQYDCAERLEYYLDHEDERAAIAAAGQRRTLNEHTYHHRMQELVQIIDRYLRHPEQVAARRFPVPEIKDMGTKPTVAQKSLRAIKAIIKRTPLAGPARALWRRLQSQSADTYQLISPSAVTEPLVQGWQAPDIVEKQRDRVNWELQQMYLGNVPVVFQVAAQAVAATGMEQGRIIEIGCASGYYYEVLEHLSGHPINYTGLDYSRSLIERARREYPNVPFRIADAMKLPLANRSHDIVISGCVLLHVKDYQQAIAETARVASHWCIFHRTPVIPNGETKYMTKLVYGVPVVELAFGEPELFSLFAQNGLEVLHEFSIGRYHPTALKEQVEMKTYVCQKYAG